MILDDTISTIIVEVAEKNKKELLVTSTIVTSFYDTLKHIIENEEPGVIKADFLGKFSYNHSQKKKIEEIIKKKQLDENI